jgi:hypothetical protein
MNNLKKRLSNLIKRIDSDDFYENKGLANEIPFYIFDYKSDKELEVRDFVKNELIPKFSEKESRVNAIEIDLFDLMLESLDSDGILEKSFKLEKRKGTKFLYEKLKQSFNSEIIVKYIEKKTKDNNLILITGVGKVYPIVRTHTVLNNLQNIFDHKKVILFFPGEYTNIDLSLFGQFKDNNYYRAFKIQ